MDTSLIEIISSIGITAIIVVIIFYLWLKKVIVKDMIEPIIEPLKNDIKELKEELDRRDDKFDKINEVLKKNTESLQRLETIFELIKGKIEISFKEK